MTAIVLRFSASTYVDRSAGATGVVFVAALPDQLTLDAPATVAAATALAREGNAGSPTFALSAGAVRTTTIAQPGRHVAPLYSLASTGLKVAEPVSGYATRVRQSRHEMVVTA